MDQFQVKQKAESNRSIKFNLGNTKTERRTSTNKPENLNYGFVDTVNSTKPSLLSSGNYEYPNVGRSTSWKRPNYDFNYGERYISSKDASVSALSPKYGITGSEQELINMLTHGKRALVRYDDLDYTSAMYKNTEEGGSVTSGAESQRSGVAYDLNTKLRIQKKDMIDYDANVIIKFVRDSKWKIKREYYIRNDNARIIQNWMKLLFLKIKKIKEEIRIRNNNARIIQRFVRRIYEINFAARIIQIFLSMYKTRKAIEKQVCETGSYCSKKVFNRRTAHWAASVIQTKFRNTRRKPVEPRIRKIICSSGVLTKKVFSLARFLKNVVALQNFYRKLKAKKLYSAKVIQDFVDNDIKKKCKVAKTIQKSTKPAVKINSICIFTKSTRRIQVQPKQRVIIKNSVRMVKHSRSLYMVKYIMLLQKAVKNFLNLRKKRIVNPKLNSFCLFTKTIRVVEIVPKEKTTVKKCVRIAKKTKAMWMVKYIITLQRIVKRFLALRKKKLSFPKINGFCLFKKEIKLKPMNPVSKVQLNQFVHFTKSSKIVAKTVSRPILADRKHLDKKCMSKRIFTIIMLLQRAVKRFLASRHIYIMEKPIIETDFQFGTKFISSQKAIDDANTIKKFCKKAPKPIIPPKKKEVVNKFCLFTKTSKIQPKIFKRPLLADRSLLRKKCFSKRIFEIIMLLQRIVRKFLEKLHVKAVRLPIIDDSKQYISKRVTSQKFIDTANKIKNFMKPRQKVVIKPIAKPVISKIVIFTKEIKKNMITRTKPRILGPQLSKKTKSGAIFGIIMLLQKAVKKFLANRVKDAVAYPLISPQHQFTRKVIKSLLVHDYAKRIQDEWRRYRNRPIPEEVKPISKKKAIALRMSKKVTSTRIVKYIIYLQRFFRKLFKKLKPVAYPRITKSVYMTKEIKQTPPVMKQYPRLKPVGIEKTFRLNFVTRKRCVMPMLIRSSKATVKLGFIIQVQRYIRRFLKLRVKPQAKPMIKQMSLFTKRVKSHPNSTAFRLQGILKNFILIQRRKKAIAKDHIRRMAIANSFLQLKKGAMYSRRRLYNIDFVLTLERQAIKVAQQLVFMKLAERAGFSKNLLNENDDRENYYYRTIKGLRNLAQATDKDNIDKDVAIAVKPTFRLVLEKFPQEVRNIYSYKWFNYERLHDDNDLWQTHVYRSKTDPNFIMMIKYLLKDHELPVGYIERRIKKTAINNLTIFALLQLAEIFLYDYYNDLVCKACFCKKEDEYDDCHCHCHEYLKVRLTVSRKKVVEEDELDPLARISKLKPKSKYNRAYDQILQKEYEDMPRKSKMNDREPVKAVHWIKDARGSNTKKLYRDYEENTVEIGNIGYALHESLIMNNSNTQLKKATKY
jgi:hypothetical protein